MLGRTAARDGALDEGFRGSAPLLFGDLHLQLGDARGGDRAIKVS